MVSRDAGQELCSRHMQDGLLETGKPSGDQAVGSQLLG